ncbi:MAG: hypothetical protein IGQ45_11760 [Cyanobacterium sp. T60_A2020_053]|nr:hypothetical protein [Cyanobacterium sp. T60_A2020_053]
MSIFPMQVIFSFSLWSQLNQLSYQQYNTLTCALQTTIKDNITNPNITLPRQGVIAFSANEFYHLIATFSPTDSLIRLVAIVNQNITQIKDSLTQFTFYNYQIQGLDNNFINQLPSTENLINLTENDWLKKDDDFYNFSLSQSQNKQFQLLVSSEQYKNINNPQLPFILSGEKGAGKTTTAVYSALKHSYEKRNISDYKIIYITKNQHEKKQVNNLIKETIQRPSPNLIIEDYQSFAKNLAIANNLISRNQFLAQRQVTKYKFLEQFCQEKKILGLDYSILWQEIKQIIKGSKKALKSENNLISIADYLALRNQSFFPQSSDFNNIYEIANQYQNWLETNNYWDETDLAQYLHKNLSPDNSQTYHVIYIDDTHHLNEVQIQLIFDVLKIGNKDNYLPQLFFIGEDNSLTNNVNLGWGKVKKIAVEEYVKSPLWIKIRSAFEPKELSYNFQSGDAIANLKASLVNLTAINAQYEENITPQSSWLKNYPKPLIISGLESEILEQGFRLGAGNAIVVMNENDKKKLISYFPQDSERIVLINQLEDLQFKGVLVWKLFSNLGQNIQSSNSLLAQKYRLIYNSIRCATEKLYFYDQEVNEFWNLAGISDLIELGYPTELDNLFEENNQDINSITEFYFQQGNEKAYKIVSQLYFQANDILGAAKIEALLEEIQGNWGKAGDIWNKLFIFDEAIRCWNEVDKKLWEAKWASSKKEDWSHKGLYFEEKHLFDLANYCYDKADDFAGKLRCLEANNQWELAGDKCRGKSQLKEAQKYYELADQYYREIGNFKASIQMWTKLGKLERVAVIWEHLQQWEKAGNCWQKVGEIESAAVCWQKAEKWLEAQKCWLELERWEDLALSYEQQKNWTEAAQTWLKQGNTEKGAFCYQWANQWDLAENLWRELECWGYVAIALQQQQKWQEAAQMWAKTSALELEALCYQQLKDWQKAEESWLKANNWRQSVMCAEKQGKWLESAESWENLGEWHHAGKAWEKVNEWEKAALCYEQGEYWQDAERCWRNINELSGIALSLEKQGKWLQAVPMWESLQDWEKMARAYQEAGDYAKAGEAYEKAEKWRAAEDCWRLVGNQNKVDEACVKQGKWQVAANDWLKSNQIEKAALCYENCQDWERAEKYWRMSGNWEKLAPVCEEMGRWEDAATAYLKVEDMEKAALCYQQLKHWAKAEECWRKIWQWEQVAQMCEYQEKWAESAKAWALTDNLAKAVEYYEKIEDWENAENCWRKLNNWEKLAQVCEYQDKWEEAAQLWNFLSQWQKAAEACLKMDDIPTAIKYYEQGGYVDEVKKYRQLL